MAKFLIQMSWLMKATVEIEADSKNNSCCVDIGTWGSATAKDLLSKEKKDCGL